MIIDKSKLPENFEYPKGFLKVIALGLLDFGVWELFKYSSAGTRMNGLKERYPDFQLIPFARRGDNDDVACFEVGKGDTVIIIHDYSDSAYKNRIEYDCFWNWFKDIIEVMIEFE